MGIGSAFILALSILLPLIAIVVLTVLAIRLYRTADSAAEKELKEIYEDVGSDTGVAESNVDFEFYTYHGFLNTTVETRHAMRLPYGQAVKALKRFHRFNLKRGIWGLGAFFIPFISLWNRSRQMRRIDAQLAEAQGKPVQ